MNSFLTRFAEKHAKLGLSRTMVLQGITEDVRAPIAAYYTIAVATVNRQQIPQSQSLPVYPLPVAILARLAVDNGFQGKGIGGKSLVYALRHVARLSSQGLPVFGLVLDVLDDDALNFYNRFDFFNTLTDNPKRLFVSMKLINKL